MKATPSRKWAILGIASLFGLAALIKLSKTGNATREQEMPETMVFAAASLRDVMHDVGSAFQLKHRNRINFNIAASNDLAHQITAGGPADIFISANSEWLDHVEKAGRIVPGSRKAILSNRIVIIAHASSSWTMSAPQDLVKLPFQYLSLANPDAVPAGKYARQYLSGFQVKGKTLWEILSPKVAPTLDVRAALAVVAADPSIVGIVYRTDAVVSNKVKILFEIPEKDVPPIVYTAARIQRPDAPYSARMFYEFLFTKDAQRIFQEHGFAPLEAKVAAR